MSMLKLRYSNKKISRSGYLLYRNRYSNKDSSKPVYILRGLFYRIIVDAFEDDLVKKDSRSTRINLRRDLTMARSNAYRQIFTSRCFLFSKPRQRPGKVLHIDSCESFLKMCRNLYKEAGITSREYLAPESEQPNIIKRALAETKPDILVVTGHDSWRKAATRIYLTVTETQSISLNVSKRQENISLITINCAYCRCVPIIFEAIMQAEPISQAHRENKYQRFRSCHCVGKSGTYK